jgi:hypothetical protein
MVSCESEADAADAHDKTIRTIPRRQIKVGTETQKTLPHPEPISNPKHADDGPLRFAHPAEEAFARVLDFYQIEWEYEPTTFPLEWDQDGRVATAFSPDFYLVNEKLYVELTTMKQSLVTKKNRKLRLLQELYPDVKCKLMYRRDVMNLAVKYGLFGELSPSMDVSDEDEDDE